LTKEKEDILAIIQRLLLVHRRRRVSFIWRWWWWSQCTIWINVVFQTKLLPEFTTNLVAALATLNGTSMRRKQVPS